MYSLSSMGGNSMVKTLFKIYILPLIIVENINKTKIL